MKTRKIDWLSKFNGDGMLRIDFLIPLMASEPSGNLVAAFEDVAPEVAMEWLKYDPKSKSDRAEFDDLYLDQEVEAARAMLEFQHGRVLAHISSPVVESNTYSWGYTYNKYILGDDIEDVIKKAYDWIDNMKPRQKK